MLCNVGSAKNLDDADSTCPGHVNLLHLFNILKGGGGYISKMTQDAKLGHLLNVAVCCTGQEEGEEIITMTQNANYDHMFNCNVGSQNCKCRKPILWCNRGIVFQGKERSSKYKDDVTFLLCSYIQRIGLQR